MDVSVLRFNLFFIDFKKKKNLRIYKNKRGMLLCGFCLIIFLNSLCCYVVKLENY